MGLYVRFSSMIDMFGMDWSSVYVNALSFEKNRYSGVLVTPILYDRNKIFRCFVLSFLWGVRSSFVCRWGHVTVYSRGNEFNYRYDISNSAMLQERRDVHPQGSHKNQQRHISSIIDHRSSCSR